MIRAGWLVVISLLVACGGDSGGADTRGDGGFVPKPPADAGIPGPQQSRGSTDGQSLSPRREVDGATPRHGVVAQRTMTWPDVIGCNGRLGAVVHEAAFPMNEKLI